MAKAMFNGTPIGGIFDALAKKIAVTRSNLNILTGDNVQSVLESADSNFSTLSDEYSRLNNNLTYSSEETVCGTWNGKTLYRRLLELTTPSTTIGTIAVATFDADWLNDVTCILKLEGVCCVNESTKIFECIPWSYNNSNVAIFYDIYTIISNDTPQICVRGNFNWNSRPVYVTVEYTKD